MRNPAGWPVAVAFWTFLGAVALIVLAPVAGPLVPASLTADGSNAMGILALLLLSVSHALPLIGVFRTA